MIDEWVYSQCQDGQLLNEGGFENMTDPRTKCVMMMDGSGSKELFFLARGRGACKHGVSKDQGVQKMAGWLMLEASMAQWHLHLPALGKNEIPEEVKEGKRGPRSRDQIGRHHSVVGPEGS